MPISAERKFIEGFRWVIYVSVPIFFGYVLAGTPEYLDFIREKFPSAAEDPQGPHGRQLPDLQAEYDKLKLEAAVDATLQDLIQRKKSPKS